MEEKDIVFTPHSDMEIDDVDIVTQHNNLINKNKFGDATTLIKNYSKGFVASLFNLMEKKIRMIQEYLLNEYVANYNEYYSYEEPTPEFMEENGYVFWMKLY